MRPARRPSRRPGRSPSTAGGGLAGSSLGVAALNPVLTLPTDEATGATTADLTITTNQSGGFMYVVVTTSATPPTQAQVRGGLDHAGAAATFATAQAVTASGLRSISATGLTTATGYWAHFMHENVNGFRSTVASGDGFTTS